MAKRNEPLGPYNLPRHGVLKGFGLSRLSCYAVYARSRGMVTRATGLWTMFSGPTCFISSFTMLRVALTVAMRQEWTCTRQEQ